jgi:hypothetical protein
MGRIAVTKEASAKLLSERNMRAEAVGKMLTPRLLYYHRAYSKRDELHITEYGPMLILSFVDYHEMDDGGYLPVELSDDCTLLVGPAAFFRQGQHVIDWSDKRFHVRSSR